jgi:hypothetical protein
MKQQDTRAIVAIILACGVVFVLGRYVWTTSLSDNVELVRMFKELLLVIIGVLAGYISRGADER